MRRGRSIPPASVEEVRDILARTSVLAVCMNQYDYLENLNGAAADLSLIREVFAGNPQISLFNTRMSILENPRMEEFRSKILDFAASRTSRGEILIFYFSGFGAVMGSNRYGFCVRDTRPAEAGRGVFDLSVVDFTHIVQTLAAGGVNPIFILDTCFSPATAPHGSGAVLAAMQDTLHSFSAGSYALWASSTAAGSFDTVLGGLFTRSIHSVLVNGFEEDGRRRSPLITVGDITAPLQEKLAAVGQHLAMGYVGASLPPVPLAKNAKFRPDSVNFTPYMGRIVEYVWNGGAPREINISELLEHVGPGAYANHSKLSYQPWGLLEDGPRGSTRRLTERGASFAEGRLSIPRTILRDPVTWDWVPGGDAEYILLSDV